MKNEPEAAAPTNWAAITPEEWAEGITAVAARYGVTRQSAHAAKARLDRRNGTAPTNGRPRKECPANLDPALSIASIARHYAVSWPTAAAWKSQARASESKFLETLSKPPAPVTLPATAREGQVHLVRQHPPGMPECRTGGEPCEEMTLPPRRFVARKVGNALEWQEEA